MRPWALRALVMTAVYGVGQAASVAARAWAPDLDTLWTLLFLGLVLATSAVWAGAEVVLGRIPEEWSWFKAALAAAPAAGVLSWILLALFVDGSGVVDLGPALVGRAAFTALLIMASTFVGTRLGWFSLRRRGEGTDDPMLDRDETDPAEVAATSASGAAGRRGRRAGEPVLAASTVEKVARRRRARDPVVAAPATDSGPTAALSPEEDEAYRGGRPPWPGDAGGTADRVDTADTVDAGGTGGTIDAGDPAADEGPSSDPGEDHTDVFPAPTERAPGPPWRAGRGVDESPTPRGDDVADERPPSEPDPTPYGAPVVAVLPTTDPRFGPPSTTDPDAAGSPDDPDREAGSASRGPRRSVAEAARAARIARERAEGEEKSGDKRRRGPRRRPGR